MSATVKAACPNQMKPLSNLSQKIVTRLVDEGLLLAHIGRQVLPNLSHGTMGADDWRKAIEQSDPEED
jgi:hypothetical protein